MILVYHGSPAVFTVICGECLQEALLLQSIRTPAADVSKESSTWIGECDGVGQEEIPILELVVLLLETQDHDVTLPDPLRELFARRFGWHTHEFLGEEPDRIQVCSLESAALPAGSEVSIRSSELLQGTPCDTDHLVGGWMVTEDGGLDLQADPILGEVLRGPEHLPNLPPKVPRLDEFWVI